MAVTILRLGHRLPRDERTTTHVALVARALGAKGMVYTGEEDEGMEESVTKLAAKWGGKFEVRHEKKWETVVARFRRKKAKIVHLTMYGIPLVRNEKNAGKKDVLLIVGGEKVPIEIYHASDENVAVTGQPHSEVGALAVWLWENCRGKPPVRFTGAHVRVIPTSKGKRIHERHL